MNFSRIASRVAAGPLHVDNIVFFDAGKAAELVSKTLGVNITPAHFSTYHVETRSRAYGGSSVLHSYGYGDIDNRHFEFNIYGSIGSHNNTAYIDFNDSGFGVTATWSDEFEKEEGEL